MTVLLRSNSAHDNKIQVSLKDTYARTLILVTIKHFPVLNTAFKKIKYLRETKHKIDFVT